METTIPILSILIGMIIGNFIGSCIGAILLRAATKWVIKQEVPFIRAYWTIYLSFVVIFLICFCLGLIVASSTGINVEIVRLSPCILIQLVVLITSISGQIILLPVSILIQSLVIGWRLHISFGKALLVNITMLGIGIAVFLGMVFFAIVLIWCLWPYG